MALFNHFFKRKKEEKKEKVKKEARRRDTELKKLKRIKDKQERRAALVKERAKKEKQEKAPAVEQVKKRETKVAPRVLRSAQITEKATDLQQSDQYVFRVFKGATKPEIKKAIEEMYGVEVIKVRTVSVPGKRKRLGRDFGFKQGYKKAVVTLKKGQSIEILPR